ncbi:PREDICTED: gibberellic acid methyltransferase 1-like isoform X1 [Camelina sativa]|uniref:Gibberellic acid methyltransferase 1-like isoform X1 n=1 Tax=Camelina sativa TaxID=90675 RepID=A0ABM0UBK3_CAMSA|nr:PREDICTED: gibberellic acid methyltransferase 1-like isoform X1 [Camelina sativa]
MLTSAMEFYSRFPQVHESGEQVRIGSFGKDKALEKTVGTLLRSAYGSLYGDPMAVDILIDDKKNLDFHTIYHGLHENIFSELHMPDSLHVATAGGLEWLSKEEGWNKGKAWIEGADQQVVRAYAEQAEEDLLNFLKYRKNEIKIGGSLFMMIGGRPSWSKNQLGDNDKDSSLKHPFTSYMDQALQLLVDQDVLDVKKRDGFNIRVYLRSTEEVKAAIDRCGGFQIEKMVNLKIADNMNATPMTWIADPSLYGKKRAELAEDAAGQFITDRFGSDMKNKLFERYAEVAKLDTTLIDKPCFFHMIAVSVTRI